MNEELDRDVMEEAGPPPSLLYYFHSLLLMFGRILGMILDFYNRLFDFTSHDRARIYGNIATHYVKKGMYDKALQYLEKWVRSEPGNAEAHYRLGIALADCGHNRSALDEFEQVLSLRPHHKGALMRKCSLLLKIKDHALAAENLEAAVLSAPNNAKVHYMLGIAYEGVDELEKAIEAMERAVELAPEEIRYHQHLGFLNVRRDDHQTAAKSFTRVMELERELDEQEGETPY